SSTKHWSSAPGHHPSIHPWNGLRERLCIRANDHRREEKLPPFPCIVGAMIEDTRSPRLCLRYWWNLRFESHLNTVRSRARLRDAKRTRVRESIGPEKLTPGPFEFPPPACKPGGRPIGTALRVES